MLRQYVVDGAVGDVHRLISHLPAAALWGIYPLFDVADAEDWAGKKTGNHAWHLWVVTAVRAYKELEVDGVECATSVAAFSPARHLRVTGTVLRHRSRLQALGPGFSGHPSSSGKGMNSVTPTGKMREWWYDVVDSRRYRDEASVRVHLERRVR